METIEVYFFSGTGNSMHVARSLRGEIPGVRLSPIVSLLGKDVIRATAESVGFVFPIHFLTIPMPLRRFLEKFDPRSVAYTFAVATRCGTPCEAAFDEIAGFLRRRGKSLHSRFVFNMADNNPRFKNSHLATREEVEGFERALRQGLPVIRETVVKRVPRTEPDRTATTRIHPLVLRLGPLLARLTDRSGSGDSYYAGTSCTGCGTCERVCLAGKVRLAKGKPLWDARVRCFACRACLNYCPTHSVQIQSTCYMKSYTEKHGRYSHPGITAADIASQKEAFARDLS